MEININEYITVTPTKEGWQYIQLRVMELYHRAFKTYSESAIFIEKRTVTGGGFKEQMSTMIEDYPKLFHRGTDYIKWNSITLGQK